MKKTILAMLPALALFAFGCSDEVQKFGDSADGTFVWHGHAYDAKTGAFLNFFTNVDSDTSVDKNDKDDDKSTNQIWALVAGQIRSATPCKQESTDAGLAQGCFFVDGLPLDGSNAVTFGQNGNIPVFARHSGYVEFASQVVSAESTHLPADTECLEGATAGTLDTCGNNRTGLLFIDSPQVVGNFRMFPTGVNYDVNLTATFANRGVANIVVRCVVQAAANRFDVKGDNVLTDFLAPNNNANAIVTATTDSNGRATLTGASLTKGASYDCAAHGTDLENGAAVSCDFIGGGGTDCLLVAFIVGVSDPNIELTLAVANSALEAIWSNVDDPTKEIGENGPVTIILNRAAAVMAGTADCQGGAVSAGTVNDGVAPALVANVDDEDAEAVTVGLDAAGTTLSVTPNYLTAISNDRFVTLAIGGIYLQPTSGINTDKIYQVGTSAAAGTAGNTLSTFTVPATCGGVDGLANIVALVNLNTGAQVTGGIPLVN